MDIQWRAELADVSARNVGVVFCVAIGFLFLLDDVGAVLLEKANIHIQLQGVECAEVTDFTAHNRFRYQATTRLEIHEFPVCKTDGRQRGRAIHQMAEIFECAGRAIRFRHSIAQCLSGHNMPVQHGAWRCRVAGHRVALPHVAGIEYQAGRHLPLGVKKYPVKIGLQGCIRVVQDAGGDALLAYLGA